MALPIRVAPLGDEWTVQAPGLTEDLIFRAGGKAETAARALAARFADEGRTAELKIYLRDGSLAGSFVYPSRGPTTTPAW